jgi:hypothetical protein
MNEYDITEYALHHKDSLKGLLDKLSNETRDNPILASFYREAAIEEIRQYIAQHLELSYLDVAEVVDDNFMEEIINA